jgi:hypothetical protein
MELAKSPLESILQALLQRASHEILISSPFINHEGVRLMEKWLGKKSEMQISILTNLSVQNIIASVTQPNAILKLCEGFKTASVSSLHRLHAKIYVIDEQISLVTSANLTHGGLRENYEYGVVIENSETVRQIKNDLMEYRQLANQIALELLKEIAREDFKIQDLKKKREKEIEKHKHTKALKRIEQQLNEKLLSNRVQHGQSINEIFSETILYLLRKHRSLTTRELHHRIKEIHPDICDDKIDGVINGQRFGKLWKHSVRNAQRFLKASGKIENRGQGRKTAWFLKE